MLKITGAAILEKTKVLGRTFLEEEILWCGLSGSGVAFHVKAKTLKITFAGDNTTQGEVTEGKARVAIYINDDRVVDRVLEEERESFELFAGEDTREVSVRIIKLSECAMSTMGIAEISMDENALLEPEKEKNLKLEFIGDSITCGFGIDMEEPETDFQTATEDVTKAYAYRTAKLLDADYSMVSFSGYGIISGYTDSGVKQSHQLVPSYYEKVGFSYAKPLKRVVLSELSWDFSKYQPDMVIVNLGTNDDSYCQEEIERQKEYQKEYVIFLQTIRKNNPNAYILCTLGIMGGRLFPFLDEAVKDYQSLTGDTQISTMKFEEQRLEDGYVSAYHPTVITHEKAARKLSAKIKELLQ